MKHNIILVFLCLFLYNLVYSCTCIKKDKLSEKEFFTAEKIFIGKVLSIEKEANLGILKIKVVAKKNFKNTSINDTILIISNIDSGLCGLTIKMNENWYFFLNKRDNNSIFREDVCGRSSCLTRNKFKQYGSDKKLYRKEQRKHKRFLKNEFKLIKRYNLINH